MLLPFVSNIKLISEELTPGQISLVSAKEGPLGATYRLSFAVEVLCDLDDLASAGEMHGITPEDLAAPQRKSGIQDLVADLQDEKMAPELYARMEKYGIEDVVDTITEDDFIQFLHFLREQGKLNIALKLKRPDYWSNKKTYVDKSGAEQEVTHTDYRAGGSARGTDAYTQKALASVWATLASQAQDLIIDQVVDLFAEVSPQWQAVIFGENLDNINIQLYKGNEKFNNPETVGHDSKCGCKKCKEFKGTWHYPYRTEPEMQGRLPYAYDREKWQKLATQVKKLVDRVGRKLRKAKTPEEKEYYSTRLTDLMAKGERLVEKMQSVESDITASGKRVLFVYVVVDLERFVRTISVTFRRHLKRQASDENYAKSTTYGQSKNGQVVEIWPSGLSGLKDMIMNIGKLSHDEGGEYGSGIYGEIVDVIEDGMGDSPVVDLDNDGNIYYIPYDAAINQEPSNLESDLNPAIQNLLSVGDADDEVEGEKGGHETEPRGKLSKKPTWVPQTWGGSARRDNSQSESIEKIAQDL